MAFALGNEGGLFAIDLKDKELKVRMSKEGVPAYFEEYFIDESVAKKLVEETEQLQRQVAEGDRQNELRIYKDARMKEREAALLQEQMNRLGLARKERE